MLYTPDNNSLPQNNAALHESFISIYKQYKEKIYMQAFYLTSCPDNAEDIVQDVFLKLWKQKHRWAEIENIQAYLFFCTRNRTMDYFQQIKLEKANRQKWKEERLFYDSPEQKMEIREIQKMHEAAVRQLPPRQREVYTLRRFYGWERGKIARELNISECTVKRHIQVAIRSVKKFMIREIEDLDDLRPERPRAVKSQKMFSEY